MKTLLWVAVLLAAVALVLTSEFQAVRATLIEQREAIGAQWARVELALEARADLVARLVPPPGRESQPEAALRGELLRAAVALASATTTRDKIRVNGEISAALARLPRPKTREGYESLSDGENRIAVERRRYNELLEHYNAMIQRFPENVVARVSGFRRDDDYLPTETQLPPK